MLSDKVFVRLSDSTQRRLLEVRCFQPKAGLDGKMGGRQKVSNTNGNNTKWITSLLLTKFAD